MAPLLDQHREALGKLAQEHRVLKLEVFGSALTERFDPERSDIDLLVEFEPMAPPDHADCYLGLLVALEDMFGRSVDLIEPGAIRNPFFKQAISQSRQTLYAA